VVRTDEEDAFTRGKAGWAGGDNAGDAEQAAARLMFQWDGVESLSHRPVAADERLSIQGRFPGRLPGAWG
jgi:hypothetical protein